MNVTEESIRQYVEVFHQTLATTAEQFLPAEHRTSLTHSSLLPATIVGYVSTQFGAAIEYFPAAQTEVKTIRGSGRIEDILLQAPSSVRSLQSMLLFQEGNADYFDTGGLYGGTFTGGFPFRLAGINSGCRLANVRFQARGWQRDIRFAEVFGRRTVDFWNKAQAVARAKDEVLAALAQTKRAIERKLPLSEYIAKFKERTVLLLGDYDDAGLARLHDLADAVAAQGYDPILVKDIPDISQQDLSQKVAMIGGLARFVIVDDSTKSGHLSEVQLCRVHNWITILLRDGGKGASWMTAGVAATSNVILELAYDSSQAAAAVEDCAQWAENKISELGIKFDSLFPWRRQA